MNPNHDKVPPVKIIVTWQFLVGFVCLNSFAVLAALQPFNGIIGFGGTCTLVDSHSVPISDNNFISAVAFGSINGNIISKSGIYTNATSPTSPIWTPFSFNMILPVNPMWVFTNNGSMYKFELTSSTVSFHNSSFLIIGGTGIAHVDGFADTPGTWSLATQTPSIGGNYSFSISAPVNSTNIPALQIAPPTNGVIMSWNTLAGQSYQLQYTTNLTQNNWSDLGGAITATNSKIINLDSFGTNDQRFYRVVLVQ